MSALRINRPGREVAHVDLGRWVDTFRGTGEPAEPPVPRKATPAELARFDEPVREEPRVSPIRIPQGPPKAAESIGLVPRHREAFRSDLAVIDALRASHGNISAAGDRLGMSCSGVWRRVDRMRRSGSLPADLVTGRAVQYAARRARGFRA